jgi:enoyl-CoA hydratase/carnithine racemase
MSDVSTFDLASARIVVWDRQARRNAWSRATIDAIAAAIEAAGVDGSVRCVIVRGAGEHFSAGDDLHDALAADRDTWAATVASFQQLTRVARTAPIPVIAAIDGVCIGGALEFAASCDLRFATTRARFGTPEVRIGLVATNAGTLLLPEVLGETAARQLLLTGELYDAGWARDHGFVTEVVPPAAFDERIDAWARTFDGTSRYAVGATKAMLNERLGELPAAAMAREEEACVALFDGPDARQALAEFARR